MPTIKERNPDILYGRIEHEDKWAAGILVALLLMVLGVFAFLVLSTENAQERPWNQMDLQQQLNTAPEPPPVTR